MEKIEESTLIQLYKSAIKAFPNTTMRQHATNPIKVVHLEWMPFKGMKTLFVKGLAQNEDRSYNTIVLFKKVKYLTEQTKDSVKLHANDGLTYLFEKLALGQQDVLVRCNCPDFRWRFNNYNSVDKSLYGTKAKAYESKGGPPANPMELAGMCKHLMKTMKVLQEAGLFA